jgi:hypothetical protein
MVLRRMRVFVFGLAAVAVLCRCPFCSAEEQQQGKKEAPAPPTKDECMHHCTEEIENIVFTTESLKSSMQTTIDNLRFELGKVRAETESKDVLIEKAKSERNVWKSKADALQMQMDDVRRTVIRKQQEIDRYRSFLDEKERSKMDDEQKVRDEEQQKRDERYEKKLKLDEEHQKRMAERRAKGLDPHGDDGGEVDEDEDDLRPEPGSKKYYQRIIENLEFTMESLLKSSHNCQHQLSQCLGDEVHPMLLKSYNVENALEEELHKYMTSRMNVNWCLVNSDVDYWLSYVGLGSGNGNKKCPTTTDVRKKGSMTNPSNPLDSVQLPPEHLAAQAQARAATNGMMGGGGGFPGFGMAGGAFPRSF